MSAKVTVTFSRETVDDSDGDTSYLTQDYSDVADLTERAKYKEQDAERLAAYKRGDWAFVGIRAEATIRVDHDNGGSRYSYFHKLTSPGLWGIESDSDESYFDEVFKEECAQLKADIEAMKDAQFK